VDRAVTAGNGRDNGVAGLRPCFLELKRCVPRMKREQPHFLSWVADLAVAPCFVLPGHDQRLALSWAQCTCRWCRSG
jgi:hypothetical protein